MDVLGKMKKELLRRKYSPRTISTYLRCVRKFINKNHKDTRKYNKKDIKDFLDKLAMKGASGSTINVNLQALKFMMESALNKRVWIDIKYSKDNRKRFPEIISREEVKKLFSAINNEKHNLMIKLMYGAGLRVSELVNLKSEDLNINKGYGWVRKGKGNKDRPFIVPRCLINKLFILYEENKGSYLFRGKRGRYSTRTVQEILKKSSKKAGLKHVHPHMLRHSFATHPIDSGEPVMVVQALLGHSSSETTMRYVHMKPKGMINVKSPLDSK